MSVTAPAGFVASGGTCGLKESGASDLALVATVDGKPVPTAAVFTSNKLTAAPVRTSHAHLQATAGHAGAVIVNSGNANAATGAQGLADSEAMCAGVAAELGLFAQDVLVASTGLIGIPLPVDKVLAGIPGLVAERGPSVEHAAAAAEAMRTTDTHRKEALASVGPVTVGGMAKGAAMLSPNMATMLAILTTDAAAEPAVLQRILKGAVDASFNVLDVDGCTSTNDTVILMASGAAGAVSEADLARAVTEVCTNLAAQMAGDAEGATKTVRVEVSGAATDADAAMVARAIARSQLVKCSWYGEDPYWGRVASEAGSAGVAFDPELAGFSYGGVQVALGCVAVEHDTGAVAAHMAGRDLVVGVDLGLGTGSAHVLTNDLTHAYIDENMGTS